MSKKLVITFDGDTTDRYLKAASARLTAEVDASVEPSSLQLTIEIGPSFLGSTVYHGSTELGEATTELIESDK